MQLDEALGLIGFSFGCLPRRRTLAFATLIHPLARVRIRIRSASNSATIASTLKSSQPTGSVGSWTTRQD